MIKKVNFFPKIILIVLGVGLVALGVYSGIVKKSSSDVASEETNSENKKSVLGGDDLAQSQSDAAQKSPEEEAIFALTKKFLQLNHDTDSLFYTTRELMKHGDSIKKVKSDDEISAEWQRTSGEFSTIFNKLNEELEEIKKGKGIPLKSYHGWVANLSAYSMQLRIKFREMNGALLKKKDHRFDYFNERVEELEKILNMHLNPKDGEDPH